MALRFAPPPPDPARLRFTDDNTYFYIGHSSDILSKPLDAVPPGCVYANSEICGLAVYRANQAAQLKSFANPAADMWKDPLLPANGVEINKLLLTGSAVGAGAQTNLLGLYTTTFTDSSFFPLSRDQDRPLDIKHNISWGRPVWGVISRTKAMRPEFYFAYAATSAKGEMEPEHFPLPGFYEKISYDTLKRKTLAMCIYPDAAAFDAYEKETGRSFTFKDGRPPSVIKKTRGGPDVWLDASALEILIRIYLQKNVSDIMKKYPGVHYNFMCREAQRGASPAAIGLRRWNSIRLGHHTLEQTLTESFYRDEFSIFKETLDKILTNNTVTKLYEELLIEIGGRTEAQLGKYDGLEKWLTQTTRLRGSRNYKKAPDSELKLRYLRAALCAKGKGVGCPAA